MPLKSPSLQKVVDFARLLFSRGTEPSALQLDLLRRVLGHIPLSDLALDDPSARPGAASSPPSGGGRPPISYIHIYEDQHISLGIFCMPRHAVIPLHNHPGMTVFSRVLYGDVHILSFDWADQAGAAECPEVEASIQGRTSNSSADRGGASGTRLACQNGLAGREATSTSGSGGASCADPGTSGRGRRARRVWDRPFSGEDAPVLLRPTAGGNIHQFTALDDCAVLDLLTPPYCPDVGRDCTYFRALRSGEGDAEGLGPACMRGEVLLETHLPQDESAILDAAYQGKPVLARPLQLIAEEYRTVLEVARRAEQG